MELLLNLFWFALGVGGFAGLARTQRAFARNCPLRSEPDVKALLALSCVLVLLFPIISASDDLHPSQALLEDATKRVQQRIGPLDVPGHGPAALVPVVFIVSAWCGLSPLGKFQPAAIPDRVLYRGHRLDDGRSPPAV